LHLHLLWPFLKLDFQENQSLFLFNAAQEYAIVLSAFQ